MTFFHGILVNEPVEGVRPILEKSTAVIGLIATAPNALTEIKSKLLTGAVGTNNGQTFTSKRVGVAGDGISNAFVNLATSNVGAITTTATLLAAAIAAHAAANALVGVANTGASSGAGVVTAMPRTSLAGGRDEPFPLDTPVLITNVRKSIGLVGEGGTAKLALEAIADQGEPLVVLVRIAVEAEIEDQVDLVIGATTDGVYTGIQALLVAESRFNVKPRILGAPGFDTQEVVNALIVAADQLRGYVYAACRDDDGAMLATRDLAAVYRNEYSARECMLIWPDWTGWSGKAVATALGTRAMLDQTIGWHQGISNIAVKGVTGISHPVSFDIRNSATDAGVLNQAPVTTLVQLNGYRFWGCRGTSDEPFFAFEVATRTAQAIQDAIADAEAHFIGKPMTVGTVRDIVETANARLSLWRIQGRLIGGTCWYDPDLNPIEALAAGALAIDYDYTYVAPLEGLTLNQRITGKYYLTFAQQLGG
jgi:phage tail sheath protein FI